MTIQDVLERAKKLRREQQRVAGAESSRHRARQAPMGQVALLPNSSKCAELQVVRTSSVACRQNNIITLGSGSETSGPADSAYRLLRSRIENLISIKGLTVIAFTSPEPADGKTTTTINLACSIARKKQQSVFLLDLDMRRPSVLRCLGIDVPRNIAEFFAGQAEASQVLYNTDISNVIVAGCTQPIQNASELLASPNLQKLFETIKELSPSGIVLVDLPPANATDEAYIVSPYVDAIVLVVSERGTNRAALIQTMANLDNSKLVGIVYNKTTSDAAHSYKAYY